MKKLIEVTPLPMLAMVPAAGFYDNNGMLYLAASPNCMPLFCGMVSAITEDASTSQGGATGGVSEQTLLKAIAIAMRPDAAKSLIG